MSDSVLSVRLLLDEIEREMQKIDLWQGAAPAPEHFESVEPFCIDTMDSHCWLQWVFIPRMRALIEANTSLPANFALHPYFEETLKQDEHRKLLLLIKQLDELFG